MQLLLPTAGSVQKAISVVDSLILHDLAQYTIQDVCLFNTVAIWGAISFQR